MNVTNRIADEYRRINPKMDPPVKSVMQLQLMGKTQHPIGHGIYHDISKPRNQNRHAATQSVGRLLSTNRDLRLESFVGRESFVQWIYIFHIFSFGVTVFASKKLSLRTQGPYCLTVGFHLPGFTVLGTQWLAQGCARPWCQGADLTGNILRWPFFWDPPVLPKTSSEHGGWRSMFHNMMPHYKGDNCYR